MKQVLQQTLAFLLAFFLTAAILALVAVGLIAAAASDSGPKVPDGCILTIDFSAPLTERGGAPDPIAMLQGEQRFGVPAHAAAAAIRHAADDDRVKGVLLHGGVNGSASAISAVRAALGAIRDAKKPVLAYYGSGDEKSTWLASAADELWMEPLGLLVFDGMAAEVPYFGDALRKYGIEVQVTRVGKYKSAAEPFMLGRMSAENREQIDALIRDVQRTLLDEIAAAKGLERSQLEALIASEGWLQPERAIALGLVTKAAPFGELLSRLRRIADVDDDEDLPQVDLATYAEAVWKQPGKGDGVRVIVAEGEIVDGGSAEGIGGDDLARKLRAAREDDRTKAVVLRVDSPGGSATASDVIRQEVLALKAAGKPVVVSMGRVAGSGGYWISANADAIVAQPETITGSIGVFGLLPNCERLAEEHGVRSEIVRTGPLAGIESLLHHKDQTQIDRVQALVDRIYDQFVDLVAEGRGLPREKVQEIAQGRVWSGLKGLELGLVDELGGLDRAIAIAREKAHLDGDAPVRFERREPKWYEELIEQALEDQDAPLSGSSRFGSGPLGEALALFERLGALAGASGVVARLPYDLAIE